MGSKRVKNKNLRLLGGKPLICHVIETCKKAKVFDDIYINSESDLFKPIAEQYGAKFYKRPEYLASDTATNDEFVFDFIKNVPCDIIIQVNPTSPFITVDDIKGFVNSMLSLDTLLSVKEEQIEALYGFKPLNYDPMGPMPRSQDLKPIHLFSSGIMGWRVNEYLNNMAHLGCATYGGKGNTAYYTLRGISTVDIDTEEDFQLAEAIIKSRESSAVDIYRQIIAFNRKAKEHSETDVPSILKNDGVVASDFEGANKPVININDLIKSSQSTSWSKRVINTENNSATLICQLPGEGNRLHYHPDWNEWWYIVSGKWWFEIEGETKLVYKGDLVFIEKGKWHKITAAGPKPAIRLAVSREDVPHVYQ